MRLAQSFYNQHVFDLAQSLLGKLFVFGDIQGIITETEAYRGEDDEASHAYRGMTNRSKIMFGPAGYLYVYMIYGMYYCANIVAESQGQAAAVLIRGLQIGNLHLDGPGKVCRHLGITQSHNGVNLNTNPNVYLTQGIPVRKYQNSPRIGIKKAVDLPWRFFFDPSSNISK